MSSNSLAHLRVLSDISFLSLLSLRKELISFPKGHYDKVDEGALGPSYQNTALSAA